MATIQTKKPGYRYTRRRSRAYKVIDRDEYHRLQCDCNSPRAISTMAYLGFKRHRNYNTYRAKSRIIVLGNHKYWDLKKFLALCPSNFLPPPASPHLQCHREKAHLPAKRLERRLLQHPPPRRQDQHHPPTLSDPDSGPIDFWLLKKPLRPEAIASTLIQPDHTDPHRHGYHPLKARPLNLLRRHQQRHTPFESPTHYTRGSLR